MRAGLLSAGERRQHPWRNVVTRALSGGEDPEVDRRRRSRCRPGDRLLISSDGLYAVVLRRDGIAAVLDGTRSLEALCAALVDEANAGRRSRQRHDASSLEIRCCITCVQLLRYRGADPEPRRARAQGALPRLGARLLLVVHQPAAAAGHLLVRVHRVLPGTHAGGDRAVRAVHVLRHPAVDVVLRRR